MNIKRTPELRKPVTERWYVKDKSGRHHEASFNSTSELLASGIDLNGRQTSLVYKSKLADEYTVKDRFDRSKTIAVLGGIGGGALLGASGGIEALDLAVKTGLGKHWSTAGKFGLGVAAIALTAGAIGMLLPGEDIFGKNHLHTEGLLLTDGDKTILRPELGDDVNLTEYQHATVPDLEDGQRHYGPQWWNQFGRETV